MIEIKTVNDVVCVHGTPSGKAGMSVYVFLTDGLLIDTGAQILLEGLVPFYESADFDLVALTHYHEDHTGGAAWIMEHKKVPIFIHPMSVDAVRRMLNILSIAKYFGERETPLRLSR
ncbi:MBL fold metallo-hydrolase [Peribacillus simplex]|uniref:MBL fold metallo-hydrolase n=1 Tax=Peribacillus simplex TaxID=1478 RepID=UPI000F6429EE|nr:MBL fold metallo-hydrolase [Peribacillus simplex]RRN72338.1 MBL fold metallo-hydrolase [Peribacillus simplex]